MLDDITRILGTPGRRIRRLFSDFGKVKGPSVLIATLIVLSFVTTRQSPTDIPLLISDQVATEDIVSPIDFWYEDTDATDAQRRMMREVCPIVYEFNPDAIATSRRQIEQVLAGINRIDQHTTPAMLAALIKKKFGVILDEPSIVALADAGVQKFIVTDYIPWVSKRLQSGIVAIKGNHAPSQDIIIRYHGDEAKVVAHRRANELIDMPTLARQSLQILHLQSGLKKHLVPVITSMLIGLVRPTLTPNDMATKQMVELMMQSVKPVYTLIRKGDVIIAKGDMATVEIQNKLQAMTGAAGGTPLKQPAGLLIFALIICLCLPHAPDRMFVSSLQCKDFIVISAMLTVICLFAKGLLVVGSHMLDARTMLLLPYLFPVSGFAGLCTLLWDRHRNTAFIMLCALFSTATFHGQLSLFLTFLFTGILLEEIVLHAQTRHDIIKGLIHLFLGISFTSMASMFLQGIFTRDMFWMLAGFDAVNTLLSICLLFALSPIMETGLHYTTRFRLIELMNMDQPLLQELMVSTPGTYHHSLLVSNMAEAGAKLINANSLLCKVGALYHDIGKLARPEYFIENQADGPNRHDGLAPSMSAMILASHIKKGVEIAQTFHLGDAVTDIIQQHHGTSLMRFFYNKAKELGSDPKTEEFSYPGPRPQTKEAAIVMLADVVEASTRTLQDPTPARLTNHVNNIFKSLLASGQLDDSTLTFKDANSIAECFVRILTGIYHHRIAYPDAKHTLPAPSSAQITVVK